MPPIEKSLSSSRYLRPVIALFFGWFIWLEGANIFIETENRSYLFNIALFFFLFITLCFLFRKFKRINLQSKILVLIIALSISLEFYVLMIYNWISSEFCWLYPLFSSDIFIILFAIILSILGVIAIVFAILIPRFQTELTYLTNLVRIKNRESSRSAKFLEIWTSFPVFIGIHYIFFFLFGINNINSCNTLPFNFCIFF